MRSSLLLLGVLIPLGIAVAYYGGAAESSGQRSSAVAALYAGDGASVVTGNIEGLLSGEVPVARTDTALSPSSPATGGWLGAWPGWTNWLPQKTHSKPLLVIVVAGQEKVALARRGVRDERISGETAEAFVVDGDRLVAANRAAAAAMIMLLDWVERPIQLVAVAPKRSRNVLRKGRRNSDAPAWALLDPVATEVAAVRGSDQARVQSAIEIVQGQTE